MADKKKSSKKNGSKKNNIALPVIAAIVVIAAALAVIIPKATAKNENKETVRTTAVQTQTATANTVTGDIIIDESTVSETASFYDYNAGGTTVEVFAVKASDGTVRLALNTCQVCMGSPYAFFVQQGDSFICQNCKNAFDTDSIGIVHGGCNPVPITEDNYQINDGKITVSAEFLEQYASSFENWKKF
ncbi:MAG: DUF2318 domain-containing protein [Eubacterium sp.]